MGKMLRIVSAFALCPVLVAAFNSSARTACAPDPGWASIAEYKDDRNLDDIPNDATTLRSGFSTENAFYLGDEAVNALTIEDLSICAMDSSTCQKICVYPLRSEDMTPGDCDACARDWPSPAHRWVGLFAGSCGIPGDGSDHCTTTDDPYLRMKADSPESVGRKWQCAHFQDKPAPSGALHSSIGVPWHVWGCGITLFNSDKYEFGWHTDCCRVGIERAADQPEYDTLLIRYKGFTTTTALSTSTTTSTTTALSTSTTTSTTTALSTSTTTMSVTTTLPNAMCSMRRMRCPIPRKYRDVNYVIMGNGSGRTGCTPTEEYGNVVFDFDVDVCNTTVEQVEGYEQYSATLVPNISEGTLVFVDVPLANLVCTCTVDLEGNVVATALDIEDPESGEEGTMEGYSAFVPKMVLHSNDSFIAPLQTQGEGYVISSERFFLGISSNDSQDIIAVRECTASPLDPAKAVFKQTIWREFCPQGNFGMTEHEHALTNELHHSVRAFKFAGENEVSLSCTIIRCASKPCGVDIGDCNTRRVQPTRRLQQATEPHDTVSQSLRLHLDPSSHAMALPTTILPNAFTTVHSATRDFDSLALTSSIKLFNVVVGRDKKYMKLMSEALAEWVDMPDTTLTVWEISAVSFQDPDAKFRRLAGDSVFAVGEAEAAEVKFDMVPNEQSITKIEDELARLEGVLMLRQASDLRGVLVTKFSAVTGSDMTTLEVFKGLVKRRQFSEECESSSLLDIAARFATVGLIIILALVCSIMVMARGCCRHRRAIAPKLSPVVGLVEDQPQFAPDGDLESANQTEFCAPSSPVLKGAPVEDVNDKNGTTATEVMPLEAVGTSIATCAKCCESHEEGEDFGDQHRSL